MSEQQRHGRLSVNINEDTSAQINRLTQYWESSATEVVRRAMALLDVVTTERAKGWNVELYKGNEVARINLLDGTEEDR